MEVMDFPVEVSQGKIDLVEHIDKVLEELQALDRRHHMMSATCADLSREQSLSLAEKIKGKSPSEILKQYPLLGIAVSLKDAICAKGVPSSASSGILRGYTPVFDATVVERIKLAGGIIIGKTTQDEFGFGSFAVNVGKGFDVPTNPFDKERCCGGSSGGAGALTAAATFPHIALGESTGGSIAAPAAFCGVIGLTPTYGLVSRHGLIDYGNSLDKIGPMGTSLGGIRRTLEVIEGHDHRDATSLKKKRGREIPKVKKVGIIKEGFKAGVEERVSEAVKDRISTLEGEGFKCLDISLPHSMKYALSAYYIIAMCEASTNLARYCGLRYGIQDKVSGGFDEYFTRIRSESFGREAKRRIILGTFARMAGFRESYYIQALKVRTKIINEYKLAFKKCDVLLSPSMPVVPQKFKDIQYLSPLEHFMMDVLLVGPNLSGLPHLSVPCPSKVPIGTLLIGDHLQETRLIELGKTLLT